MDWIKYEWRVAKWGCQATWGFIRGHIVMELIPPILAALFVGGNRLSQSSDDPSKTWTDIWITVLAALVSWAIVIITVLVRNLILAPYRMEQELRISYERALLESNQRNEELQKEIGSLHSAEYTQERRRGVQDRLARYLETGHQLFNLVHERSRNLQSPVPDNEAEAWAREIEEFLKTEGMLGDVFIARFRNFAGLPTRITLLSPPYSKIEGYVVRRMARLDEFIKELR